LESTEKPTFFVIAIPQFAGVAIPRHFVIARVNPQFVPPLAGWQSHNLQNADTIYLFFISAQGAETTT